MVNDKWVEVQLDLTDAELLVLFKMAHERDMTFNKFVNYVLEQYLNESKAKKNA